jgi:hypothetical protein
MSEEDPSRLCMEIELLGAMYPEQATYDSKSRELKFTQDSATLQLRLPPDYPAKGLPDVIAATDASKNDLRSQTKSAVTALRLAEGEETLDAIIAAFQQVLEANHDEQIAKQPERACPNDSSDGSKTVIIWLHHLLALTKRKLAISPTTISGITKPGYPGVMLFSGPSAAVTEHVNTLKAENWQAFQVRYEDDELWHFAHGSGVKEVETMGEMVKDVDYGTTATSRVTDGPGKRQKDEFLKAVGIK